jgi:WD40 repeat protein
MRVALHPDGGRIVSASNDYTVRLWDTNSGAEIMKIPMGAQVYLARFAPDGATLVAAPMDGTIRLLRAGSR